MTFEPILLKLSELVEKHLPADSPWRGRVTPNVADPKDLPGNTWCVVELSGPARELILGNFTMQASARMVAVLVPPEGPWPADEVRAHLAAMWQACSAAVEDLRAVAFPTCLLLDVRVGAPVEVQTERAVGYVGEVEIPLVVQF